MAATSQPALPAVETPAGQAVLRRNPAIRAIGRGASLWHLLSLDAPTVAMIWTWFLARTNHIRLPPTTVLAMGIAVWMLYAADRLLDSRGLQFRPSSHAVVLAPSKSQRKNPHISLEARESDLEARHYFHRNHQSTFRCGILGASILLALLLPHLALRSIQLYLVLGTLLFGYFILIHFNCSISGPKANRLPKEFAVGVFFSAAAFIPTISRNPSLRPALFPGFVLFALLCSLNCLFICRWEHPVASPHTHPATKLALRFVPHLAVIAASIGLALTLIDHSLPWPIAAACSLAAVSLLVLHRSRRLLMPTTLRAAADICLLTPLLFLHH